MTANGSDNQPVNRRQFLGQLFRDAARTVTPGVGAGGSDEVSDATAAETTRVQRTDAAPPPAPPRTDGPDVPHDQQLVAYIKPIDCLAFGPTVCTVCSERCPEPGVITLQRMRPTVNTDTCTGCGICQQVCPAPDNAVLVVPRFVVEAQQANNDGDRASQ